LLGKVQTTLEQAQANETLTEALVTDYDELRPLLERQQQTQNTLSTLALLQQTRSNRSFWYVLLADQQSYFTQPLPVTGTNQPAPTNAPAPSRRTMFTLADPAGAAAAMATNAPGPRPGYIAELCIPEDAESARRSFSQLVNELKQDPLFARVDSLSDDLRRSLADPKVLLPDRHFALALELADAQWLRPALPRRKAPSAATNVVSRSTSRLQKPEAEAAPAGAFVP
jgi:hypothetical protein